MVFNIDNVITYCFKIVAATTVKTATIAISDVDMVDDSMVTSYRLMDLDRNFGNT